MLSEVGMRSHVWQALEQSAAAELHLCCRAKVLGSSQAKVSSNVLRQVEQTDLIQYGLIPEFVGRFPIISSLQVRTCCHPKEGRSRHHDSTLIGPKAGTVQCWKRHIASHKLHCPLP